MNFSHIDRLVPVETVSEAQEKFNRVLTELALRDDNSHVGSGRGGNNLLLVWLIAQDHMLTDFPAEIQFAPTAVRWNDAWLRKSSLDDIRDMLDKKFATVSERSKVSALTMVDAGGTNRQLDSLRKYAGSFPFVERLLSGQVIHQLDDHSDSLTVASVLAQDLADRLDNGDESKVEEYGRTFEQFPNAIVLFSIRKYVSVDRIIRHKLDLHSVFGPVLHRVVNSLD